MVRGAPPFYTFEVVKERGTPRVGVKWVELPDNHLIKTGDIIRQVITWTPAISDADVENLWPIATEGSIADYIRMTNSEDIQEGTSQATGTVGDVKPILVWLYGILFTEAGIIGDYTFDVKVYGVQPLRYELLILGLGAVGVGLVYIARR